MKKILIAVPTNKYVETETMKSIYDLIIPEGYSTELQFFYGYQIDQIRNLIADWGKRFDLVFHVDSDIILPPNTLVNMINADKDIISGLYIQRKENEHILEVYQDKKDGGVENIPYWAIKGRGIIPVAACGFGCVLIKGDVYRKMPYPQFLYRSAIDHRNTLSEDIHFCMKARNMGYMIWADTELHCDHKGSTFFKVQKAREISHLEKVAMHDLLPKEHSQYLKTLDIQPKVIYDIGACVLHWTRKAKEVWMEAEFYLLDAANSVQPFLEKSNYPYAISVLSDSDGRLIDFYENVDNPGGNSYYLETTGAFTDKHKTKRITITLDTLVKQNKWKLPDLIKIDVQGAELDILLGAKETIKNCNDIILECQHTDYNKGAPKFDDICKYMNSIGYKLVSEICRNKNDGDYHFKRL